MINEDLTSEGSRLTEVDLDTLKETAPERPKTKYELFVKRFYILFALAACFSFGTYNYLLQYILEKKVVFLRHQL